MRGKADLWNEIERRWEEKARISELSRENSSSDITQ
jgi:hypothetical protein